jgi:hypothetical protein
MDVDNKEADGTTQAVGDLFPAPMRDSAGPGRGVASDLSSCLPFFNEAKPSFSNVVFTQNQGIKRLFKRQDFHQIWSFKPSFLAKKILLKKKGSAYGSS